MWRADWIAVICASSVGGACVMATTTSPPRVCAWPPIGDSASAATPVDSARAKFFQFMRVPLLGGMGKRRLSASRRPGECKDMIGQCPYCIVGTLHPVGRRHRSEPDADVLGLHVPEQGLLPLLPAVAGPFRAAERRLDTA